MKSVNDWEAYDRQVPLFPLLAMAEGTQAERAGAFFRLILSRDDAWSEWHARIAALVTRYAGMDALGWLGQELMESLSALFAPGVTVEAAEAWNDAWRAAGKPHSELEIPLRLLAAATQWRKKPDRRILLRLPIEERSILEAILPPE
jgi:hypothetical protein